MDLLTITALLFVSSVAFFHANGKRTSIEAIKSSRVFQRGLTIMAWATVALALALMVSRKGWEVGIPLWLGAWIMAAVLSVFLAALWRKAHLPTAALSLAVFALGLSTVSWGIVA